MFGDSKGADQKYIAYQEAAAFPNRSVIIIDQPAHGASDILTPLQIKAIRQEGDLRPVGAAQASAVKSRIPGVRQLVLTAEALGARVGVEIAAAAPELDLEVLHMFGFDMPGLEKRRSIGGVGLGFLLRVPKSRSLYQKGEANQNLSASFEDFQKELAQYGSVHVPTARTEAGVWKRQRSLITFLLRNSPLANDRGAETLQEALESNQNMMVNLVFGGLSAVGRLNEKTKSRLAELNYTTGNRIDKDLWPDDDQGMGYAHHRPRLTAYEKDHLGL